MSNRSVYDDLRAAIASGSIQPQETLVESEVMSRFDAGRPAVRTALARLEQEGLVEHPSNRSARVRLIDEKEAVEIYEARALLEGRAAALAADRATPADIAELRRIMVDLDAAVAASRLSRVTELDTQLHRTILTIADNRVLIRLQEGLHGHLVRYHHRTRMDQEHSQAVGEHHAIVDAIAAGDASAASAAMNAHLERLTRTLAAVLGNDPSSVG